MVVHTLSTTNTSLTANETTAPCVDHDSVACAVNHDSSNLIQKFNAFNLFHQGLFCVDKPIAATTHALFTSHNIYQSCHDAIVSTDAHHPFHPFHHQFLKIQLSTVAVLEKFDHVTSFDAKTRLLLQTI
jgi:hypothetical protein